VFNAPLVSEGEVEALLFDLGGVVLEIDFDRIFRIWADADGCDTADLMARFVFDHAYEQHERGEISMAEYCASLRQNLGLGLSDAELTMGWNALYGGTIPDVLPLLRAARNRFPLYGFTNSNPTHQAFWEAKFAAELSIFNRVFVSSELGRRKPEPEAYQVVAELAGIPSSKFLFFDDSLENVEGALAAGMQAVLLRGTGDLTRALENLRSTAT
jgi:HAD superfamily hydrolase (TIGR01509 family)